MVEAKSVDSEAVFEAIEANTASNTRRVSGGLGIWLFTTQAKTFKAAELYLTLSKYCKSFDSP